MAKADTLVAFKNLIVTADKVKKSHTKIKADFDKNEKALRAAIAAKKRHLIETHTAILRGNLSQITAAMPDISRARGHLQTVNQDEDFAAEKADQIAKPAGMVDDAEAYLTGAFQTGKRLENDAEKGLTEAIKGEKFELQELMGLHDSVKAFRKDAKAVHDKSLAVNDKAGAAAEARNGKALAAAQAEMKALKIDDIVTMNEFWLKQVERVAASAKDAKLSPDVAADIADGANDERAEMKGIGVYVEYMQKHREYTLGLSVAEIDTKKALKVLGLDAKFEAKLKKALEGPAAGRVKALDAIAAEAKLEKTSGKAMEALLIKQKIIA